MNVPLIPATLLMPSASPLPRRERVGEDGARVADEERAADALHDPEDQQPERARAPGHPVDGQQQRRHGVDDEAEVVHPAPAEQVTKAADADHEHAAGHQVAEDHPQQVRAVAWHQRVEADAAEDVRHRDDHDRRVDGGQHAAAGGTISADEGQGGIGAADFLAARKFI
jgi:hypothetical protein